MSSALLHYYDYELSRLLSLVVVQQMWKANITRLHRASVWWSKLIFLNYVTDRPAADEDRHMLQATGQVGSSEHVLCHVHRRRRCPLWYSYSTNLALVSRARPNVAIILEVAPQ